MDWALREKSHRPVVDVADCPDRSDIDSVEQFRTVHRKNTWIHLRMTLDLQPDPESSIILIIYTPRAQDRTERDSMPSPGPDHTILPCESVIFA